jgi:UDPglucose 6-dehydrogenase
LRIGVIGLGYVGLVTAAVLADQGHIVIGVDIDESRVNGLNCGRLPFFEPGLRELIDKNRGKLFFSRSYSDLSDVDVAFLTVSTPTVDGKIYLGNVFSAAESLSHILRRDSIVVVKSTVIPGTSRRVKEIVKREVVVNPEFLREGNAIFDTLHPDRVVIGSDSKEAGDLIEGIWSFTGSPILRVSMEEAELVKYAANSFLALKVSFINEVADLCERLPNCDIINVARAIGMDKRIGPYFLSAGLGWGGSCLPKDTAAFVSFARDLGYELKTIKAAIEVNNGRPYKVVELLKDLMGYLKGRVICVLGVAFKPNTDDTRESVALRVINLLLSEGARVIAYDPKARVNFIEMVRNVEECVNRAEGVVIATEWDEFKGIENLLRGKFVVDGRRVLKKELMDSRYFRAIGLSV